MYKIITYHFSVLSLGFYRLFLGWGIPRFIIIFSPVLPGMLGDEIVLYWCPNQFVPSFSFFAETSCFPKHFGETLIHIMNIHVFFNRSLVAVKSLGWQNFTQSKLGNLGTQIGGLGYLSSSRLEMVGDWVEKVGERMISSCLEATPDPVMELWPPNPAQRYMIQVLVAGCRLISFWLV